MFLNQGHFRVKSTSLPKGLQERTRSLELKIRRSECP